MNFKKKAFEWLQRYLPAEIAGTLTALVLGSTLFYLTKNRALAALVSVMGENVGFYGVIVVQEIRTLTYDRKSSKNSLKDRFKDIFTIVRNLILEFGLSEVLDSTIIRPTSVYIFSGMHHQYAVGAFVGKMVADTVFYGFAIISYEARKKYLGR